MAIVESCKNPVGRPLRTLDEKSETIADHIIDFLQSEVKSGRLPQNLLPLQSGVGTIANAVVGGLLTSPFDEPDRLDRGFAGQPAGLFDSGKLDFVPAASFALSDEGFNACLQTGTDIHSQKSCCGRYRSPIMPKPCGVSA